MSVWDTHGNIEFGDGEDSVARIIENRIIHAGLVKRLEDFSNVTLLNQTTVTDIGSEDERPVLTLNDGMKIRCDLLVV
jgi:2-polyprenyl-6-methoxyphenol hydroxylase-like FAD-dependent oxidoreductase